ncbi:hypothetical protein LAW33_17905 [Escherichia coli]|nr:hypothetical protein [Escherichia coli]
MEAVNITIMILYLLISLGYIIYLLRVKAFHMNAEPLTHQPLFKAAITFPILSFFSLGMICWFGHKPQIDAEGFNNFLNISKLPLAALSLSIPFGVIVNNIHRTIQTDKQIKEAEKKNKIDFFYAHRKNTIEVFQNYETMELPIPINSTVSLEFKNCYSLYRRCFPHASTTDNDFNSSMSFIHKAEIIWAEICILLDKEEPSSYYELHQHIHEIEKMFSALHLHYGLKDIIIEDLYLSHSAYTVYKNEKKHLHTTKFSDEADIKKYIQSYWHLHLSLTETLDQPLSCDFKTITLNMAKYSINPENKYPSFRTTVTMKESIPTFKSL